MDKSKIIEPSLWCQRELWRLIYHYEYEVSYIDNPWFPRSATVIISWDGVTLKNEGLDGRIELQKGRIILAARPCVLFLERYEASLFECGKLEEKRGEWLHFDQKVVPFLKNEYVHAEEMYRRVANIFKTLVGFITDKLSP